MQRADNKLYIILTCTALVLFVLAAFEPVRHNQFVNFDDYDYVLDNQHVTAGLSRQSVFWAFTGTHLANWHPLTTLSYMLDCELFGLNPFWHHLTNLLLHTANTVLLFLILKKMTGAIWQSAFVAAVFAVHPLRVESVAWTAERKDVLSGLFWMLTIAAYTRYTARPCIKRYLLVFLLFCIGLLAKPMLVTLPFVLLLLDYWPLHRLKWTRFGKSEPVLQYELDTPQGDSLPLPRLILEKIPLFALSVISSVVTFIVQKNAGAMKISQMWPISFRLANALVSYVRYIVKMLYPTRLSVMYPPPAGGLGVWKPLVCFAILAAVSVGVIYTAHRRRYLLVGWMWYVGTLFPVIGLVQVGVQMMADRYTYLPSIGLLVMVGWGAAELANKWHFRKIRLIVLATIVLAGLFPLTRAQVKRWRNSRVLFSHAIEVTENNYVAHNCLGMALQTEGRLNEAIGQFRRVLQIRPEHLEARNNLGAALLAQGKLHKAIICFREVLRMKPDYVDAINNLAWTMAVYPDKEFYNPQEAVRLAEKACSLTMFGQPELLDTLAVSYGAVGRFAEAVETGTKALNLAKSREKQQLADEVEAHLKLFSRGRPYFDTSRTQK